LQPEDKSYFTLLKKEIALIMKQSYPAISEDIADWKGQEITDLQEDLRIRVNGQVSEKWFYSHFKNSGNTLPRIDVLNLLSRYAGYSNWEEFKFRNGANSSDKAGKKKETECSL